MKYKLLRFSLLSIVAMLGGLLGVYADNTLTIDFESEVAAYSDWNLSNIASKQTNSGVAAHGGSYFGSTGGNTFCSITTKEKIARPQSIVFYISKLSTNTAASTWKVQVSSDGETWTDLKSQSAGSGITKGTWKEVSQDLSTKSDVYVRIAYDGTAAIRTIDDVTLTYADASDPSVATTVTIDASGITNTNIFIGTDAGQLTATVKADDATVSGAAVTWTSSDEDVATIDDGTVTLVAAGETTITASYAGVEGEYKSSSATYKLTVINKDPNGPGSEKNPYTVAQAREAIDAGTGVTGVYAKGIVSMIVTAYNATNGNISYNISVDGTTTADQLQAYSGKSYGGANFASADDVQVGDEVVVYGNLKKYKTSTYEFDAGNQLVSLKRKQVTSVVVGVDQTGTVGGYMELPLAVVSDASGSPIEDAIVTWSSSDEDVAKVDGTVLCLLSAGTATITATFAGDDTYKGSSASFKMTVSKSVVIEDGVFDFDMGSDYGSGLEKSNVLEQESTWTAGNVTMTLAGRNCWNDYGNPTLGQIRLYRASGGGAPGSMTLSVPEEKVITEIEFTGASLGNMGTEDGEYEASTWTGSANSVTFTATNTTSIYTIVVTYEDAPAQPAGFRDVKLNLMDHSELLTGSPVYITIAENGTISTTDNAENAAATIKGNVHGSYGSSNFTASVPVEGCVKITYATHDFGNDITVTNSEDETVATLNTNGEKWMSNHDNVVVAYYRVNEPTTLNFSNANYNPYFAVEAIDEADLPEEVTEATLTFDATEAGADGTAPAAQKVEIGSTVTIPANTTLYKNGYTLTAWTDGTIQYKAGDVVTVDADMTLTPVFTQNTVSLAEREEAVTVTWQFGPGNGAGTINGSGIFVTQATVGSEAIDVKMDIDASNGKFNNVGRTDKWAQVNGGTKVTVPSCKGATVELENYSVPTGTTIDGQAATIDETAKTASATITSTSETIDVVAGNVNNSYWSYLTVVLPVVSSDEPEEFVFRNFEMDLRDANGGILTADEAGTSQTVTFGISVAEDGTVSRVEADADNTAAVITGTTGNNHGLQDFSATIPVEGPVQITMSTCSWGGDVTVKNAEDETVATFTTKKGEGGSGCYGGNGKDDDNIVSAKYVGEATTLTISGGVYVGYFAIDAVEASSVEVAYSLGDVECQGDVLPIGGTYAAGDEYAIPAQNFTLYKEGYTLTGWSDGTNTYNAGATITLSEDITLTPVFTENTVSLADRTEAVTVKFDFQRNNGAPSVQWQNKAGLVWVAQATVNGNTIDVPARLSTNPGKFNNTSWGDWCQINEGTSFTIPSCKDAVVSVEAYSDLSQLTIDGQDDYTSGKTISYTVASSTETVDVVFGNEGQYYRYIQVVLPVVQSQGGGESYENVAGTVTWTVGNETSGTVSEGLANAFSATSSAIADKLSVSTKTVFNQTMLALKPATKNPGNVESAMVEYRVKTAAGLTFTPTKVTYDAVKNGTDNASYSYSYVIDGTESTITTVPKDDIIRNNNTTGTPPMNHSLDLSVVGCSEFAFRIYVSGFDSSKDLDIANIIISGTVNGTAATVNKYTLATAVVPEGAGSINVYPAPAADEYEEGTSIKLTATENFGYDFVNWTDADGVVVSTEPVYTFDIAKNETLTANFEAVETYELALTVDGTNDYMVTIDPAPTMVDGKMMYEAGTAIKLMANSYNGLVTFNNWSDGETSPSKLISMSEDVTLTAVYEQADILAGWDFYKAGNSGRKADFASADNESAALSLMNTETGETSGWLDKSTLGAGGYESLNGAAVNWKTGSGNGDVGNWHWQTKVNASQFTNINVQFQMLYNYNAYQTYNAEYSLDGENWTKFGSITMTGIKSPESFSKQLPEAANNQENLYIRMLADKTSQVDGTSSANDGNTLAMFFITGTEKLVDDETAPKLVSTVPADGAIGASATGKIVLTFDEKVKVAEGTTATLGSLTLTPVVSGKSISFEYKGLEYSSEYTFSLPANSVSDLTDNTLTEAISLTFTTMTRPTVTKGLYDEVVGNVDELVAAINNANKRSDTNTRYRIFLKNGTYTLPLSTTENISSDDGNTYSAPFTKISASNISFIGESRDGVIVTNDLADAATYAGTYGTTSVYDGIGKSDVLQLQSSAQGTYFQDLTVKSSIADALGRNLAIQDKGSQTIYKNTVLWGYQDTWTSNNDNGYYYFEGGKVRGRTDFLCGKGDAFFNAVGIQVCQAAGGYITAPSKSIKYGYVFKDCTIMGDYNLDGNYTLGRPWGQGTPMSLWIDTKMRIIPSAVGWSEMSGGWPKRFAEYNSMTSTGGTVDLSGRKTKFGAGYENNPVLTAEEAFEAGNLHNMFGDWDPTLATEQAPVPQNVKQEGNSLVWDNSNYALLWAIVKDGAVVDFTTEPTYELTESGTYAVRAANVMGGLSEASASVEATVAEMVKVTLNKGYSTLASDKALDFSKVEGLTAYIVTDAKNSKATLTSVDAAPAETGLVLKTDESGDYEIPVIASATAVEGNLLVAAVSGATVDALSVYVLDGGKFKVFARTEIPAGKAYLPKSTGARLLELVFDDATGIATVDVDVPVNVYDLQGRRVKPTKKGIYVVDGKKVIIK